MSRQSEAITAVLRRCRELSQASQDAMYASTSVLEITAAIDRGLEAVERGTQLDREELTLLFAPTGDLQETAIANGWGDEYCRLAAKFDALI